MTWLVSMYVSMSRLALFICISWTIFWNLIKLCMNINIGYAVILPFHDFHLSTKVAYIKICYKTSSCNCISGSIFWNLTKLCMNVNMFLRLSPQRSNKCGICIIYVLKHPFRQDIFKQTYRNVLFRVYILTLAFIYCTYASLNTGGIKFIKLVIV